jgi:hypothetical protein
MATFLESGSSTSEGRSERIWAAPPFCPGCGPISTWKLKIPKAESVMERRHSLDSHAMQALSQVHTILLVLHIGFSMMDLLRMHSNVVLAKSEFFIVPVSDG